MKPPALKLCLATVTTEAFVPGTLVMLHSFLKVNPWFEGDLVIIHDGLEPTAHQSLVACFERLRFVPVTPRLRSRLQSLIAFRPQLASREARFYSLEIFRLTGYDKVLFCDSDLLFCRPVNELFEMQQPLICGGDGPYYRGNSRDAASFAEVDSASHEASCPAAGTELVQTFNAGLLLIDAQLLTEANYDGLLALLSVQSWQRIETAHTDQFLYNLFFAGRQTLVNADYNFLLQHRTAICEKEGVTLSDAKVLHFNGLTKPWLLNHTLLTAQRDGALIRAFQLWYNAYIECLTHLHLRSHFARPSSDSDASFEEST